MRKVDYAARYSEDFNFWIRPNGSTYHFGLTDWAQYTLGAITDLVDLSIIDGSFNRGETFLLACSSKANTELIAPLGFTIYRINEQLIARPELINMDCYQMGWLFEIELKQPEHWSRLHTAEYYVSEINGLFKKNF